MRYLVAVSVLMMLLGISGCGEDSAGGDKGEGGSSSSSNGTASGTGGGSSNGVTGGGSSNGDGGGAATRSIFSTAPCQFTDAGGSVWTYTYTDTHVDIVTEDNPAGLRCIRVTVEGGAPLSATGGFGSCEDPTEAATDTYTWGAIGETVNDFGAQGEGSWWVNVADYGIPSQGVGAWLPFEGRLDRVTRTTEGQDPIVVEDAESYRVAGDLETLQRACPSCSAKFECD